jgi:hypothetical protein
MNTGTEICKHAHLFALYPGEQRKNIKEARHHTVALNVNKTRVLKINEGEQFQGTAIDKGKMLSQIQSQMAKPSFLPLS